ncbi:MAG: DUF2116 family Zn-ribbon domain-containing protein [Methanobacteriaceae archaeon]|jgi:predicted nucleic acid-binding Zn ribbon protein
MTKPHKHCPVCGTSIPIEENFCSPKCKTAYTERAMKALKTKRIFYIGFVLIIIVYLLYVLRGKIF